MNNPYPYGTQQYHAWQNNYDAEQRKRVQLVKDEEAKKKHWACCKAEQEKARIGNSQRTRDFYGI